jgi:hypothetical protein
LATSDCKLCSPGEFSEADSSACAKCNEGSYQTLSGQHECSECDFGFYSSVRGLAACLACDAGRYANDTGLSNCYYCDAGRYSTKNGTLGASTCQDCDLGSITSVSGQGMLILLIGHARLNTSCLGWGVRQKHHAHSATQVRSQTQVVLVNVEIVKLDDIQLKVLILLLVVLLSPKL